MTLNLMAGCSYIFKLKYFFNTYFYNSNRFSYSDTSVGGFKLLLWIPIILQAVRLDGIHFLAMVIRPT